MAKQGTAKRAQRRTTPKTLGEHDGSSIFPCYNGCMLGFSLSALPFRAYARQYPLHRQRMQRFLDELGAKVTLPSDRARFVASHETIVKQVHQQLERVSRPTLGWVLFGQAAIELGLFAAFEDPRANEVRGALGVLLSKLKLSPMVLERFEQACQRDEDDTLEWRKVHTAALALLNELIVGLPMEADTAFVAMPFSVGRLADRYTTLYTPLLKMLEKRAFRAWGGFGTEEYQVLLYTLMDKCGAMLGDLTTLNVNVMHEVGYAIGKADKFIVLISESGQSVPANLGDLTVLTYKPRGKNWQARTAGELAAAVALFQYAATIDRPRSRARAVGPMKVVRDG